MTLQPVDILSVVGARPQFVKLAPIARALRGIDGVKHRIVHTGQHYDDRMSSVFFEQLRLPKPELNLEVGSGSHGAQTAAMLSGIEDCLQRDRPDVVLVYGDTNSTLAATLAAAKLQVPVAHVESGLRSFDRTMPEEINRVATDHCCDRLYAPTPLAMANLAREDLADRSVLVGDVMRDAAMSHHALAMSESSALADFDLGNDDFVLITLHRAANTTPDALTEVLAVLSELAEQHVQCLFPMHPRTLSALGGTSRRMSPAIRIVEPLPYFDLLRVLEAATLVITDSGGLQKEAAFLKTPCITMRERTEWVETLEMGVNRLVGRDPAKLRAAFEHCVQGPSPFTDAVSLDMDRQYGRGDAANRLCEDLRSWIAREDAS